MLVFGHGNLKIYDEYGCNMVLNAKYTAVCILGISMFFLIIVFGKCTFFPSFPTVIQVRLGANVVKLYDTLRLLD